MNVWVERPFKTMTEISALYLCYQSLLEPLTQTQVVAYLEGLARASHQIVLLSFEPRALTASETQEWQKCLRAKGIAWHWIRYHKRPTVPATAWDILVGILVGLQLIRRNKVNFIHARSHVPGIIALALKRATGAKLLFDMRGFMAEEYADAGIWSANGVLFKMTKRAERVLIKQSDGIIVLTQKARDLLRQWYPQEVNGKPVQVIPCCVDFRNILKSSRDDAFTPGKHNNVSLVYAGKLGGWYLTEAMVEFIEVAIQIIPNLHWQIWTQSDTSALRQLIAKRGLEGRVTIGCASPTALPAELSKAQAGLSFIKPCISKLASSPTKVGEYLAAGLAVISTMGIGDIDALLTGNAAQNNSPVGVLVDNFTSQAYHDAATRLLDLLNDPNIRGRCQAVAKEYLDLEQIGWVRYNSMYQRLGQA